VAPDGRQESRQESLKVYQLTTENVQTFVQVYKSKVRQQAQEEGIYVNHVDAWAKEALKTAGRQRSASTHSANDEPMLADQQLGHIDLYADLEELDSNSSISARHAPLSSEIRTPLSNSGVQTPVRLPAGKKGPSDLTESTEVIASAIKTVEHQQNGAGKPRAVYTNADASGKLAAGKAPDAANTNASACESGT